ncbi:MAG TPA: DUF1800 domain-containing protein [Gemmatimonadaceae bacterium]|nr:DUF1800 domain-containing protein [Gemmatimonadaceae bacterium]
MRSKSGGRELDANRQIRQALSRLTFGARPDDDARVRAMGLETWINQQLDPSSIPDPLVDRVLAEMETQHKSVVELIADHPDPQEVQQRFNRLRAAAGGGQVNLTPADSADLRHSQQVAGQLTAQIQTARVMRAVASERQLQEVMTDFWENHFSVFINKSPNRFSMTEYDRDVIRPRALGKFRDLLGAVATSPQMLYYLDNWQSSVDSLHPNVDEERIEARRRADVDNPLAQELATLPRRRGRAGVNENYARELMELHTLGVDGGYTQADVQEVARALTGWTIEAPQLGGSFVFRPEQHDAGQKTVLGHQLPAGRGIRDGEDVLDIVARAPATARFITTKLARHFVSDDPPSDLIDRCAERFSSTDGDIRETMRCIVTSPEFFSRAAYRAKVKTPFELVVSTMRALGAPPDTTSRAEQAIAQLGQPIFGRLTPDGWPDRGDAWMNSGAILNRINFGVRVAAGQLPGVRVASWPPAARLRQLPVDGQVNGVIDELLGGDVSAETRSILRTGENPVLVAGPSPKNAPPQLTGLPSLVALALGSPEFQRR